MTEGPLWPLVRANLLASLRNPMALIYGWLFPLLFLAGFAALYGDDPVPLALHAGQFFTITILGSAAFGLPTQMVSERESGLWRHYALTPAPRWRFVVALVLARAALLAGALLLQHWAARALGMPPLPHPVSTVLALAIAGLCFLCLGALIGNLAPNVPAVQALGQCIFLPMLILGGVAVPLASLPDWALPWSNLLPGRHAVVAIQTAVTGTGTRAAGFELLALAGHGLLALLAAVLLFRWEPAAPLRPGRRGLWLLPLIGLWLALVVVANVRQQPMPAAPDTANAGQPADYVRPAPGITVAAAAAPAAAPSAAAPAAASPLAAPIAAPPQPPVPAAATDDLAAALDGIAFERLPPDSGLVAPIANGPPDAVLENALARIQRQLADWPPARSGSEEQQVRTLLLIAAVPDLLQMDPLERHLPLLVEAQLQARFAAPALQRLLLAIALHPDAGSVAARADLPALGLPAHAGPESAVRGRVMLYAFKLLGRLSGRRVGDPPLPNDQPEPEPAQGE
ncbi:ABC transporter permease [Sandarakinorhabdus sp. AAP62]|uniref:ABC transporter permease n=1 Tax=Sandarakinorhabdus sp. AAP62 TaxID=1248916 RepID=UPI0002F10BA8|nr:ABC transporter permease [Sandarakinorhabdus sp. AAP62]